MTASNLIYSQMLYFESDFQYSTYLLNDLLLNA